MENLEEMQEMMHPEMQGMMQPEMHQMQEMMQPEMQGMMPPMIHPEVQARAQAADIREEAAKESLRTQKALYHMQLIAAIPVFTGDPSRLDEFVQQADGTVNLMQAFCWDPHTAGSMGHLLIQRIKESVRREANISLGMDWMAVRKALKVKFGGMRRPIRRHVWKVLEMKRTARESPAEFGQRLGEATKNLKQRLEESGYSDEEARVRFAAYSELARDVLMREMPERVQSYVRAAGLATLEEEIVAVDDEEVETGDLKQRETPNWQTMTRRRYRSPPRRPTHQPPRVGRSNVAAREEPIRRRPPQQTRFQRPEARSKPRQGCWECGEPGHFARECPYIYRRGRQDRRPYGETGKYGEPMEVNVTTTRTGRRRGSEESASEASSGETDTEREGSRLGTCYRDAVKRGGTPPHRERTPRTRKREQQKPESE